MEAEHTGEDGHRYSTVDWHRVNPNDEGYVAGYSARFNGVEPLGGMVWLYNGLTTMPIGLADVEHTSAKGLQWNGVTRLSESRYVLGSARRFNGGSANLGESVWLFDGTSTHVIGLSGSRFVSDSGYKFSSAQEINEIGHVAGYTERYSISPYSDGKSAWFYDGSASREIGLLDLPYNSPRQINRLGYVAGNSERRVGYNDEFSKTWLFDGSSTIEIGPTDAVHMRSDGYKEAWPWQLNDVGQVLGTSKRFGDFTDLGQSAWLFDGVNTVELGFMDEAHTRSDGYRFSYASKLNGSGQVAGGSTKFNGDASNGNSTWFYDGTSTVDILTDSEYTNADGYQLSTIWDINDAGYVCGDATRFNGGMAATGQSSWLYDGVSTKSIGLSTPEFEFEPGVHYSQVLDMNRRGQVIGLNYYAYGSVGWFYDPDLDQTFPLQFSITEGVLARGVASYLSEDGFVVGAYPAFDEFGTPLGERAFYFSSEVGMHDLGSLVDGGLAANGWEWLGINVRANHSGLIVGDGMLSDGSQMAFLLTPIIPEPHSLALLLCSLLLAARVRAR